MFEVYALCDPDSLEIRYIGYTSKGAARRRDEHVHGALTGARSHQHLFRWLRKIGVPPAVFVLETCASIAAVKDAEIDWIAAAREDGMRLTNGTRGGDGRVGVPHSEETKRKLSVAGRGRKLSAETRKKMSDSAKGRPKSAAHKAALAASLQGRKNGPHSAETRAKIGAANALALRGRKHKTDCLCAGCTGVAARARWSARGKVE